MSIHQFWHFTCAHARARIGRRGTLLPNSQPHLRGLEIIWLTDLAEVDREALGLTSVFIRCDRGEFRYRVTNARGIEPFAQWATRQRIGLGDISQLTLGRQPRHWFVSERPIPVILDRLP